MYKAIIIDDEQATREGLMRYFNWKDYDIEIVGEACDGDIGLEIFKEFLPDIVITDVSMPALSGIELAVSVRKIRDDVKIIFISGYDNAEYMKSALKVEAVDYILKPVSLSEFKEVIIKVKNDLDEERSQKRLLEEMQDKIVENMPVLREKFFSNLLKSSSSKYDNISSNISFLELDFLTGLRLGAFILSIDSMDEVFKDRDEAVRQTYSLGIIQLCEQTLGSSLEGYFYQDENSQFIGILNLENCSQENLYGLMCSLRDGISKLFSLSVSIGNGCTVGTCSELYKSYNSAALALSQRFFLGKGSIIFADDEPGTNKPAVRFDTYEMSKISTLITAGDKSRLSSIIDTIFEDFSAGEGVDARYCKNFCVQLLLTGTSTVMELGLENRFKTSEYEIINKIMKSETINEMKSVVLSYYNEIIDFIFQNKDTDKSAITKKIIDIIDHRYFEDININSIAEEVYLTSTYICTLFKQETGETINGYITRVRIEKAKTLLRDRKNKLYNICYLVGYSDPSYFTKLFKKNTGLTPSEYRERVL